MPAFRHLYTTTAMTRDSIFKLRQLRDRGYIRGFMVTGTDCVVFLDDCKIRADDESLERLIAHTQLWTMLGLDPSGSAFRARHIPNEDDIAGVMH